MLLLTFDALSSGLKKKKKNSSVNVVFLFSRNGYAISPSHKSSNANRSNAARLREANIAAQRSPLRLASKHCDIVKPEDTLKGT